MEHFNAVVEDREIEISNVLMINDETKDNTVIIAETDAEQEFLTGDILFEAQFDNPEDSEKFYKMLQKAKIVSIG